MSFHICIYKIIIVDAKLRMYIGMVLVVEITENEEEELMPN
jgi:hypothetical protein